ncbi:MAG TPA: DUF3237 family protein [Polyangiaceae bacterium]|nr:DUF3237 family protein [Polyangiaceae bacterium]
MSLACPQLGWAAPALSLAIVWGGCSTPSKNGAPPAALTSSNDSGASAAGVKMHEQASSDLEHLFDLELRYQGPTELSPIGDKVGKLVGGGDGKVSGTKLRGVVRWSNYETTGHDAVCALQVPGVIRTDDGADIHFEGRELAMPSSTGSKQWKVAGVIRFKTEDRRYTWLNEILAVTSGTFDYSAGLARWRAYVSK